MFRSFPRKYYSSLREIATETFPLQLHLCVSFVERTSCSTSSCSAEAKSVLVWRDLNWQSTQVWECLHLKTMLFYLINQIRQIIQTFLLYRTNFKWTECKFIIWQYIYETIFFYLFEEKRLFSMEEDNVPFWVWIVFKAS